MNHIVGLRDFLFRFGDDGIRHRAVLSFVDVFDPSLV